MSENEEIDLSLIFKEKSIPEPEPSTREARTTNIDKLAEHMAARATRLPTFEDRLNETRRYKGVEFFGEWEESSLIPIIGEDVDEDEFPDPSPEMLTDPMFWKIWQAIKTWDINVPEAYGGYCGATVNHVKLILDAINQEAKPATSHLKGFGYGYRDLCPDCERGRQYGEKVCACIGNCFCLPEGTVCTTCNGKWFWFTGVSPVTTDQREAVKWIQDNVKREQ